jgi:hypothetical protein
MGILGILALIVQVIKLLPDIIKLIKEIMDLIHGLKSVPGFDQKATLVEFREALKEAREKKDVTRLEALHRRLADYCSAGVCSDSL